MLNTRIESTIHFQPHFFSECYLWFSFRVSLLKRVSFRQLVCHGNRGRKVNKHCSSKSYPTVIQEGRGEVHSNIYVNFSLPVLVTSADHKRKLLVFTIIKINGFILLPRALSSAQASFCHRGGRLRRKTKKARG